MKVLKPPPAPNISTSIYGLKLKFEQMMARDKDITSSHDECLICRQETDFKLMVPSVNFTCEVV